MFNKKKFIHALHYTTITKYLTTAKCLWLSSKQAQKSVHLFSIPPERQFKWILFRKCAWEKIPLRWRALIFSQWRWSTTIFLWKLSTFRVLSISVYAEYCIMHLLIIIYERRGKFMVFLFPSCNLIPLKNSLFPHCEKLLEKFNLIFSSF